VGKLAHDVDFAVGLGAVRDLLERAGIEPSEVGRAHRIKDVKLYQGYAKDADGELQVQDLASVVLSPAWEDGPEWPVVQPGPAVKVPVNKVKVLPKNGFSTCVILPDMQIGFYHGPTGELVATHDENAIDLALTLVASLDPEQVVLVGDNLDLPEFGKYRTTPAFQSTTQATIDYTTVLMGRLRAAAPSAAIHWLAGNHEERLPNYLLDNAKAAFGIRQGATPDGWPVMSVPHLCRLDDFGIDYIPGYPAGQFWINDRLRVIHGHKVKSNGSTAHTYLNTEKTSVIYGHVHRREWAERTFEKWEGPSTIMAATPGCLARIDGAVPSTKGGVDLYGRPLEIVEDWQQGIGVVTFETSGDHRFFYEQVPFHGGSALFRGSLYGKDAVK
jgi:hypothetical protein